MKIIRSTSILPLRLAQSSVLCAGLIFFAVGHASCFDQAAGRYSLDGHLLRAIASVESGFRVDALNINKDGTWDYGLMQINSSHLKQLNQMGIQKDDLSDACVNVMVGAWVLAGNVSRYGYNWNAVGAYNVGCNRLSGNECMKRRDSYIAKVWRAYKGLTKNE